MSSPEGGGLTRQREYQRELRRQGFCEKGKGHPRPAAGARLCDGCRALAQHQERDRRERAGRPVGKKRAYQCGVCGAPGHNTRTCKERAAC